MSFKTSCPSHIFRELPSTSHPQQNRLGSLATSGNLQVPSGTQKWDFFWDPIFRVEWLERSLKKKMCIFCPISFNKFKMWGLKTWVSPRKTCRKGRLRVLVGIMSRRRTEKLVVPAGKKKNESREVATSEKTYASTFWSCFLVCIRGLYNEIKAPVYKQLLEMRRNVLDTVLGKDVASVWHST